MPEQHGDPALNEDEGGDEFVAPDDGGWHYTIMRDWIAVCPDIGPTSARLYWIIRSIMHEKGDKQRRLSIDQLCFLLPGVNGKPTGSTRVEDALAELKRVGLLSNPDGDVVRRWVTDPKTGKQRKENFRRWKVHDYPADPNSIDYRSALAKLDEYTTDWRHRHTSQSSPPATETRNSGSQSSPGETRKTAGHTETRNSGSTRRNSGSTRRNSGRATPVTSAKPGSKEALQGSSSTNQPAAPTADVASGAGSAEQVGGVDVPSGEDDKAAAVLASLPIRTPLPSSTVTSLASHVASLLASGWTAGELTEHLTTDLPARYGVGLIVQRVRDTRPRAATAVETATDRITARIDRLASKNDDAGARKADQILGTRDWTPPPRDGHTTVDYLTRVLPEAAAAFVEARRDQLAEVMRTNPAWRA